MTFPDFDPTEIERADVYKAGNLAAHLTRTGSSVEFAYTPDWVTNRREPVATSLPLSLQPVLSAGGAVPAYFAGLLPEGRRLSALQRSVKTSADDELSLLLAVGSDPVGDVQLVPEGADPIRADAQVEVSSFAEVSFPEVLGEFNIVVDRVALAGVQDKVSLAMPSVPVTGAGRGYILKLNPPEYRHIVENENFFLERARRSRITAASARLVHDRTGQSGLLVTRFDRATGPDGSIRAFGVEDGCQVLGLHPEAKYRKTAEEVLGALVRVCAAPLPAALEFVRQAAFAYVTGNGDAHAKNFSVLSDAAGRWGPAPAYDLPSSQPYGDNTLALTVAGKRDGNIVGRRFVELGLSLGLNERAARRAVLETAAAVDAWIDEVKELPFDPGVVKKLKRVIARRQALLNDV